MNKCTKFTSCLFAPGKPIDPTADSTTGRVILTYLLNGNETLSLIDVRVNSCVNDGVHGLWIHRDNVRPGGCCHDVHHHLVHRDVSAVMLVVHSEPFVLSIPCHPTCDRPWPLAHPQHHVYHRICTKNKLESHLILRLVNLADANPYRYLPNKCKSTALASIPVAGDVNVTNFTASFKNSA